MTSPDSFADSALVRRLSSYSEFSAEDTTALAAAGRSPLPFSKQDDIVRPGDTPSLLFIETGWALRYLPMDDGDHQVVQIILPGDIVDSAAFLPGIQSIAAVRCATDVTARPFEARALHKLITERRSIARALWFSFMLNENILFEHIARLGRRSSAEALAHLLLELRHRLKRIGETTDGEMVLPLAQPDIGDLLGITSVHVSRTISALRQSGLIELDRPVVRFLDVARMKQFSSFDPTYLDPAPVKTDGRLKPSRAQSPQL